MLKTNGSGALSWEPDNINLAAGDGHSLDASDGIPANALYVNNIGNVGIAITNPVERLDVVGNIKANGKFYTKSGSTTSSSATVIEYEDYGGGEIWKIYATAILDGLSTAYGEFTLFIRPNSTSQYHIVTVASDGITFTFDGSEFILNTGYDNLTWTAMRVN